MNDEEKKTKTEEPVVSQKNVKKSVGEDKLGMGSVELCLCGGQQPSVGVERRCVVRMVHTLKLGLLGDITSTQQVVQELVVKANLGGISGGRRVLAHRELGPVDR